MAKLTVKSLGFAAGVSTALLFTGFASQAFAMSPFQASYQFNYNGKNLGSATRTLSKSGNNWSYVFVAKAGGIASATESVTSASAAAALLQTALSAPAKFWCITTP